jgi:20S proteasome alpha/beta subunit
VDAAPPEQVDPSGAYFGWKASAIGKNFLNAKTFLEKRYNEEMELDDAIHTVSTFSSSICFVIRLVCFVC